MTIDPAVAVTWLFVPGSRPDRFAKAFAARPDIVILDLEDAVAPNGKDNARAAVADVLAFGGRSDTAVRINPAGTIWHARDLDLMSRYPGTLMIPKAEDPAAIAAIVNATNATLIPLIETAAGVLNADSIAQVPGVCRLAFGNADLAAQIGIDASDQTALLWARSALVMASANADIAAPIDGVTLAIREPQAANDDARHSRRLGFGGKLCIHPTQILPVRHAFAPTEAEISWACRVVQSAEAEDGGVRVIDGVMVDRPVLMRAQSILATLRSNSD